MPELGCDDHRVVAVDRGGAPTVFDLTDFATEIEWGRLLDETSEAVVTVASPSPECCEKLGQLRTWRHELQIYRGGLRVWEGTLRVVTYRPDSVELYARDMSGWLEVRLAEEFTGEVDSAERAFEVARAGFELDDPNARDYVQLVSSSGQVVSREIKADSVYAIDEIRELANLGMDWTVFGRSMIIGDTTTSYRISLMDDHFRGEIEVVEDGGLYGSEWIVVGEAGEATTPGPVEGEEAPQVVGRAGGVHPYFGLVQRLSTRQVETEGEATEAAEERLEFSQFGPPLVMDLGRSATLTPEAPVGINGLVPGMQVDVLSRSTCRDVRGSFRLTSMRVQVRRGEEQVGLTLVPWSEGGLL